MNPEDLQNAGRLKQVRMVAKLVNQQDRRALPIVIGSAVLIIVVFVLVGLQDPGNLGTILRSAEAFGSAGVVLGEGTVSPFNAKVIRASAGSIFRLPVIIAKAAGGLEGILAKLRAQGVRLLATSSHKGTPLDQAKLIDPLAIFIGSEGAGLARGLMAQMDETVAIPHSARVESLNAGVAGSIVLYEAARQRREH